MECSGCGKKISEANVAVTIEAEFADGVRKFYYHASCIESFILKDKKLERSDPFNRVTTLETK